VCCDSLPVDRIDFQRVGHGFCAGFDLQGMLVTILKGVEPHRQREEMANTELRRLAARRRESNDAGVSPGRSIREPSQKEFTKFVEVVTSAVKSRSAWEHGCALVPHNFVNMLVHDVPLKISDLSDEQRRYLMTSMVDMGAGEFAGKARQALEQGEDAVGMLEAPPGKFLTMSSRPPSPLKTRGGDTVGEEPETTPNEPRATRTPSAADKFLQFLGLRPAPKPDGAPPETPAEGREETTQGEDVAQPNASNELALGEDVAGLGILPEASKETAQAENVAGLGASLIAGKEKTQGEDKVGPEGALEASKDMAQGEDVAGPGNPSEASRETAWETTSSPYDNPLARFVFRGKSAQAGTSSV
jgi:hypothetical protein